MILRCPSCNGGMETPDDLIVGQHVICPYCQIKFALEANQKVEVDASGSEILTDDSKPSQRLSCSKEKDHLRMARQCKIQGCIKWGLISLAIMLLLALFLIVLGDGSPSAMEDVREVAKNELEMPTYVSSEKIKVDFDKLPERIGAFGFKWGEKSRDLKHKYSCSIVYSVPYNGMYTMMELAYNSKGELFGITFKGPAQQQYTELNFDTNYAREAAMKSIIIDGFLPLFNILKTHAEQVLDQHIQWTFDSDSRQFLGMTDLKNGCGYAGIVRLEVKSRGGVQLLSIFKN